MTYRNALGTIQGRGRRRPGIADFARDCLGFYPDETQERVLQATEERVVVNAARMWGKSAVLVVKALHAALLEPQGEVVVVCADRWEATLIEEQIEKGRKQCGIRRRVRVTAGKAARFGKVAVGLIDDAALVKDEVYEALRTGVGAARGVLWAMGTPRGQSGFFWKAFDGAESDGEWLRVCVPAEECERLPKEFLAEERAALGEERYASEYGCLFAGEVEKRAILQWVDENGEIYGRFGPGVDWMRHRDGEWKG